MNRKEYERKLAAHGLPRAYRIILNYANTYTVEAEYPRWWGWGWERVDVSAERPGAQLIVANLKRHAERILRGPVKIEEGLL